MNHSHALFAHPDFADHERIVHRYDVATGLRAMFAIHSTVLGPAAGGCRFRHYASEAAALADVLRLSEGMTYKNAMAGLPFGGGKAVILADASLHKSAAMMQRFGDFVAELNGAYITAEDVGISPEDLQQVHARTRFVSGLASQVDGAAGGNPAPWTALGVFLGIEALVRLRLQKDSLNGVRVAVQGLGAVGYALCTRLHAAGARLLVADIDASRISAAVQAFGATAVSLSEVLHVQADVFAPCALGAVLDADTIDGLNVAVVAGAANNQLATSDDGARLTARGIAYAPDFVINAGGIVSVSYEYLGGYSEGAVADKVAEIGPRLTKLLTVAAEQKLSPQTVAIAEAKRLLRAATDV